MYRISVNAAALFLDRFRRADAAGSPVSAFVDDPVGWSAAIAEQPGLLGAAFDHATVDVAGPPALLNEDGFASAACDRHGALVVAGARFVQWFAGIDPLVAAVRDIGPGRPRVSLFADDRTGRPVALAAGTEAVARRWPLDDAVRRALASGAASHAVVAFRPDVQSWQRAAVAFKLTGAEAGLVAALGRTGDLQRAAADRRISYETARKMIASAMRKAGAKRQTELVREAMQVAAGDIADSTELARLVRDLFGLTERQARLAMLVGRGATRDEAALALNMSEHRAKSDLKAIFQSCGVASAVDLSRIIAEINALEGLATACDVVLTRRDATSEPLRLVPRCGRNGRIAVADHGPVDGVAVVVQHSNTMGRHHSRRFVQALQDAGYRPIAIERAGFGLTDAVPPGDRIGPMVADIHDVLDALGIDRALTIARCTTPGVITCAAALQGRIVGGVLLWPDGPMSGRRPSRRIVDGARTIFAFHPALAPAFGRMLARRVDGPTIERMVRSAAEGIPFDAALVEDAAERADIVRAAQQASLGQTGFVDEALALGLCPDPPQLTDARAFTLLLGDERAEGEIDDAAAFWSGRMPGVTVEVIRDAINFLYVTHTPRVIAALDRARTVSTL